MLPTFDVLVHPGEQVTCCHALREAGVPSSLHIIEGAGHGGPGFDTPEIRAMVLGFFDKHLKKR